jgi:hypothetical protein
VISPLSQDEALHTSSYTSTPIQLLAFLRPPSSPPRTSLLLSISQAEGSLSNAEARATLDEIVLFARRTLLKKEFDPPLPLETKDDDPALPKDWRIKVLKEVRDILIDEEVQRRK